MTIKRFKKLFGHNSVIRTIKLLKITLVENNIATTDGKRKAELMNKYFINTTENLNLKGPIINTTDDIQFLTIIMEIILVQGKQKKLILK